MSDSYNPQFPTELDDNFIPSRHEIQRILREEECLVEGSDGMEHLAVEVPDVFTAGCEYILKKLGYEQCEENGMWGYLPKSSLAEKQGELVAMDILKTNKDTEIAALKEENARLISERDSLFHDTEAYKQVIRYQDEQLRNMKQDSQRKTRQIATYAENYYGAMARLQHHNDLATEKNRDYLAISNKWTDVKERIEALLR